MEVEQDTPRKQDRGVAVNLLTFDQLKEVVVYMRTNINPKSKQAYIIPTPRGEKCTLAPTKSKKGSDKHPQFDLTRFNFSEVKGKQLVHLIYWRFLNNGASIDPELHISHLDADQQVLRLIQESRDMNESRKYCHLFGWYKLRPGESRPRCPHWETPCTGPQ